MTHMKTVVRVLTVSALWIVGHPASAQDRGFEIGVRPLILGSKGEPANDMPGGSIVGGWHWRDDWFIGMALDQLTFDYEYPYRALGIDQPADVKPIDGTNTTTRVAGWVERRYDRAGAWDWFWNVGIAVASVDAPPVSGPTDTGGRFEIVTNPGDEVHLLSGIGLRRSLGANWAFTTTFHLEHHLTDYRITDNVSGVKGTIGSHSPKGASFALSYRF